MRDMRLRVAKLILRGVASSTIAQAEGYPSYIAGALSSYFSYLVYPLVVNLNLNYYYFYYIKSLQVNDNSSSSVQTIVMTEL